MEHTLQSLLEQSGPRGATFMGRYIPQGQNPSLSQLLSRPANEPVEGEGMGGMMGIMGVGGTVLRFPEGNLGSRLLQSHKIAPEYLDWLKKYHSPSQVRTTLKDFLPSKAPDTRLIQHAAQLEDALASTGKYTIGELKALKASRDNLQSWVNFLLGEMK